jgi:enamine deaminase RidA (YjgF/YER057c/UK114 family)
LHLPIHWNDLLTADREELSRQEEVMLRIRRLSIVVLPLLLTAAIASAQVKQTSQGEKRSMPNQSNFQLLIPNTMPKSVGYSQLAVVTGGTVVFIAGQVALDKSGNVVGKDDFEAQVQQVFENLRAAVEAAGGTFNDIVKLNSYFLDLSHVSEFRRTRDKYIDIKNPPASTAIQVSRLFRPEFLIEIEAVAVVPSK